MVEEKIMAEEDGLDKDLASTKLTEAHAKEITELRKALAEAQANLEVRTHKHEVSWLLSFVRSCALPRGTNGCVE